jgi:fructokinase
MNLLSAAKVLVVGELLWDLLPTERMLGGAPGNFCFRLRELGVAARLVSRVGQDQLGREIRETLAAKNFDLSLLQLDPSKPTGTVDVQLTADGNPTFTINTGVAYDHLEPTTLLLEAASTSRLIYFGTLMQRSPQSRNTLYTILDSAPAAIKFLDINLRRDCYTAETITESLRRTTILKLNHSELEVLSEMLNLSAATMREATRVLMELFGIAIVLVTVGEHGAYAFNRTGEEIYDPGFSVTVVDTIGSGDSFSAAFVSKYLQGESLVACCRFGNLLGAMNAMRKGGMPHISLEEIETELQRLQ